MTWRKIKVTSSDISTGLLEKISEDFEKSYFINVSNSKASLWSDRKQDKDGNIFLYLSPESYNEQFAIMAKYNPSECSEPDKGSLVSCFVDVSK